VTSMWHKVAGGVYWVEGPEGLPAGLATTLDDGTSLKAAGQWQARIVSLAKWVSTPEAREWFAQHGPPYPQSDA
jgi:hypothetical protein